MSDNKVKIKVWDVSTRFFHWSMIVLLAALWWTAEEGEMEWHQMCAYTLGAIILFRWFWGFFGSESARFSSFLKTPIQVLKYAREQKTQKPLKTHIGHNPLGGYMVLFLLLLMSMQFVSGLFATDDVFTEGPLYASVSNEVAEIFTWIHRNLFYLVLGVAFIHVAAVITHTIKGDKLIPAMFTGKKEVNVEDEKALKFQPAIISLVLWCVVLAIAGYYFVWPIWMSM
ncbi:cytochrome b/b6 domain-containing protein [Shewanella sp. 202IG2-18]|uniref:cytochrome b/b6 domain-containing protein n=1 Tax=Parashewanella hymeniacidonis TaxID=2807618 RepID=UPI0019607DA8|nr:cytochrome b/b6 domain-containing protein [Parashewanella hymeniacidonis]MBM7071957.1 cytochrome b/b6 domain-containing protein [Parashewanella hymeniacidonis]